MIYLPIILFQQKQTNKNPCGLSSVGRASALQLSSHNYKLAEGQDFDYPSLQTLFKFLVISYSG